MTGKNFVYVYQDGKARKKFVVKSKEVNDESVIRSGLKEGDPVIVEGQSNLTDGEQVKIYRSL